MARLGDSSRGCYRDSEIMSNTVVLSERDLALLGLIEMTPVTAAHVRKASVTFPGEPFRDERRVRERLQTLSEAGFVAGFPAAVSGGGLMHYYRLTSAGYKSLHPESEQLPARPLVSEIAPSRFQHAMATSDVIVHTLVAGHEANVRILKFHGDGRLRLAVGEYRQEPDIHFQFEYGGRLFNVLFEIDNATEPLDSEREQSIKTKLLGYEVYQDWVLRGWKEHGSIGARPYFRVVFLTKGANRANHILWLAQHCARNKDRRLCYAGTQDAYLAEPRAVTAPILNDHHGHWQSLVNLHPSAPFLRAPVRLSPPTD
jgi:hypothetical protein